MMRCPECGGRDLRVSAYVCCEIVEKTVSGATYDIAEIIDPPELYWDRDSIISCQGSDCCFEGPVKAFERKGDGTPSEETRTDLQTDRVGE